MAHFQISETGPILDAHLLRSVALIKGIIGVYCKHSNLHLSLRARASSRRKEETNTEYNHTCTIGRIKAARSED